MGVPRSRSRDDIYPFDKIRHQEQERKMLELKTVEEQNALMDESEYVLIDYHAVRCGPCKHIKPWLKEQVSAFPNIKFAMVDVDEAEELSEGVDKMPTFKLFKGGKEIGIVEGACKDSILELLSKSTA